MPNWADVTYHCVGKKEQVKDLYNKIKELDDNKESRIPNGFGNLWLGNLVDILGGNIDSIYCRGDITDYNISDDETDLYFNQDCAWGEMEGVRELILKKYDGIDIFYLVFEPGMDLFYTNDINHIYFKERYYLYSDIIWDLVDSLDEVARLISSAYDVPDGELTGKNIEEYIDNFNKTNEDDQIYLRKIDYEDD